VELKKGNAKLSAMLKAGKNLDVIDEFNAMADDHHPRDATTFEIAMTAFNNEDGWKETILLWNEAPLIGVEPTGNMYAHYMHALFKSRRIEDMVAAFQDMVAAGVPRTAPVYTVLIEFYAEKGSLAGVLEAEKKMADDKITPDVPLFNALLDFYIKTGRQDDAFNVIQRMQNQGVELGVVPLAVIAERDISKGDIAAATKTMTRIQRELVARVPQFVYDALISHYLTKDDTTNAEKVLGQLRDAGYKVGVATARHFVTYYAARIDAARVSFYLQELRAANKRPDRKLCQAVLTMQFTRRALGEFKTIMTEMLDRKMKIDRIHWTQYLDLVARESEDIAAVDSTFDYVKQRGIVLDQSDYTLLLDSYCRFDRYVTFDVHHTFSSLCVESKPTTI
jgi:pentatricopeptide repeat protein